MQNQYVFQIIQYKFSLTKNLNKKINTLKTNKSAFTGGEIGHYRNYVKVNGIISKPAF